ncbi:MAG TPA: N-acetylglucosamine-6-phosphate deacetylase [Polyangia bacterium]|nr:N-acetylglucosamine-6-phosphate deacetylase [Polyangia bacterium]
MSCPGSAAFDAQQPFAVAGRLLGGNVGDGASSTILVKQGRIADEVTPAERLHAAYIAPGYVDLQVNGGFGHEVGPDPAALRALAERLPSTGVTAFLPTLVSLSEDAYAACFAAVDAERAAQARGDRPGAARILGLHLEGPLLASSRAGAHARAAIEAASPDLLRRLADPERVRLVTLAPERDGAPALIAELRARGIAVSLGHTEASFETFNAGVDAGATLATHVWNAMSPLLHRAPGATGAALSDDRVTAMVIPDGVHTHWAAFRIAVRAKGAGRLVLVTDAIAAAGVAPRTQGLALAGRPVTVDANSARLADGTLAGSTLTMDSAVRNAIQFGDLTPGDAVDAATAAPLRALGLPHDLRVGGSADLLLLDADFSVRATIVGGQLAYVKGGDVDALRA